MSDCQVPVGGSTGTLFAAVVSAFNALVSLLTTLNLVLVNSCQSPYVCSPIADVTVTGSATTTVLGNTVPIPGTEANFETLVGVCRCGVESTCPPISCA